MSRIILKPRTRKTAMQKKFEKFIAEAEVIQTPKMPPGATYVIHAIEDPSFWGHYVCRVYNLGKMERYGFTRKGDPIDHRFSRFVPFAEGAEIGPEFIAVFVVSYRDAMIERFGSESLSYSCRQDYLLVKSAMLYADVPFGFLGHVAFSYVCDGGPPEQKSYGWDTFCFNNYQSQGIGRAMYAYGLEKAGNSPLAKGKGFMMIADACMGSATTQQARLLYPSLQRDYVGHGLVLTNIRKDSPAGKRMTEYITKKNG